MATEGIIEMNDIIETIIKSRVDGVSDFNDKLSKMNWIRWHGIKYQSLSSAIKCLMIPLALSMLTTLNWF